MFGLQLLSFETFLPLPLLAPLSMVSLISTRPLEVFWSGLYAPGFSTVFIEHICGITFIIPVIYDENSRGTSSEKMLYIAYF